MPADPEAMRPITPGFEDVRPGVDEVGRASSAPGLGLFDEGDDSPGVVGRDHAECGRIGDAGVSAVWSLRWPCAAMERGQCTEIEIGEDVAAVHDDQLFAPGVAGELRGEADRSTGVERLRLDGVVDSATPCHDVRPGKASMNAVPGR